MRNIETRTTKTGPDDAGLNLLLTEARKEERRGRADVMAARLDSWLPVSCHVSLTTRKRLSCCVRKL
jgi:hypothetical protein